MRPTPNVLVERYRITAGSYASDATYGNNGAFLLPSPIGRQLMVIVSDGLGWEHVSVSTPKRTPCWAEMCWVKDQFWLPDEPVMQLHPAKADHVNNHAYCLHLWRPLNVAIPLPPSLMVGDRALGTIHE